MSRARNCTKNCAGRCKQSQNELRILSNVNNAIRHFLDNRTSLTPRRQPSSAGNDAFEPVQDQADIKKNLHCVSRRHDHRLLVKTVLTRPLFITKAYDDNRTFFIFLEYVMHANRTHAVFWQTMRPISEKDYIWDLST